MTQIGTIAGKGIFSVDTPLELWVRPADGDDASPGTSSDYPLETIQAALDKIPYIVTSKVIIHIGNHTGDGHAPWILGPRLMLANIWLLFDGGGEGGEDGFTELVASTAAIAGSTVAQIVTAGGFTPEQHRGKTIEVLTGAAAGDRRTIQTHDASTFKVCADFSSAISATDTFRIVEPKAAFYLPPARDGRASEFQAIVVGCGQGNADYYANAGSAGGKVFIVNAKILPDPTMGWGGMGFTRSVVSLLGCELGTSLILVGSHLSNVMYGIEDSGYEYWVPSAFNDGVGATQRSSWYGWGLFSANTSSPNAFFGTPFTGASHRHVGYLVLPGIQVIYGDVDVFGGNLYGGSGDDYGADAWVGALSLGGFQTNRLQIYGHRANRSAVIARQGARVFINKTDVTGLGDGIRCERGATIGAFFGANYTTVNVSGFGVRLSRRGEMDCGVPGADASAVQGALGDFTMDDGVSSFAGNTVNSNTNLFDTTEGTALWGR